MTAVKGTGLEEWWRCSRSGQKGSSSRAACEATWTNMGRDVVTLSLSGQSLACSQAALQMASHHRWNGMERQDSIDKVVKPTTDTCKEHGHL